MNFTRINTLATLAHTLYCDYLAADARTRCRAWLRLQRAIGLVARATGMERGYAAECVGHRWETCGQGDIRLAYELTHTTRPADDDEPRVFETEDPDREPYVFVPISEWPEASVRHLLADIAAGEPSGHEARLIHRENWGAL